MSVEQVLNVLRETPDRLALLTGTATPAQLRAAPEPEKWSATDVLAHLRSCSDKWGEAIDAIVAGDHPSVRAVNPRTWIKSTDYRELEFRASLEAFSGQRARLLAVLESLPPEGWSRAATVVGAGSPLERTVHDYARRLARHERSHWKQIDVTVKTVSAR
jgi:hypothetical protein